jgi:hypothetical protein
MRGLVLLFLTALAGGSEAAIITTSAMAGVFAQGGERTLGDPPVPAANTASGSSIPAFNASVMGGAGFATQHSAVAGDQAAISIEQSAPEASTTLGFHRTEAKFLWDFESTGNFRLSLSGNLTARSSGQPLDFNPSLPNLTVSNDIFLTNASGNTVFSLRSEDLGAAFSDGALLDHDFTRTGVFGPGRYQFFVDAYATGAQGIGGGSSALDLRLSLAPVPLPAGVWLLGSVLLAVIPAARRKLA